ncbi:probable SFA1 Long-chain alcohol dehydrogenase [Rhynchosporium agropyri]|uniref:Probable SFA1 Long-chain alcohol dehydrogenase n=1 Tax=Rhynchosporium agropyri TaxID=914238 RepID=A0A1E1L0D2_9HELO|nr:probable SFA1 Long-chain alcohol dehydrogenase [Rhynchosporium agropyri]
MPEINVARLVELGKPLVIGKAEKPVPGLKDVLVKVEACCLVPKSKNLVSSEHDGFALPKLPCVFGLDAAGVVEAVGDRVMGIKPGDRVYVDPLLTCGTCHHCRRGRKDLCSNSCLRAYFAQSPGGEKLLTHYPLGALSEYLLSPDVNVALLPPSIDFATASRFGYIGTSYGGLKKAEMGPGKVLLINGVTGTLGYAAVAIALRFGCTKILGIGRNKERLAELEKLSSTGRVQTVSSEDGKDIAAWIEEQTNGLGPDALYDCLGNGGNANLTSKWIGTVKRGGRAILAAGGAEGEIAQGYLETMSRDIAVLGTFWFTSGEVDELIALIDAGVLDLSFLRHEFFPLAKANDVFKMVGDRPGGAVNVVVEPSK